MSTARRRFPLVDSMRGLAALSVVAYHVTFHFPYPGSRFTQLISQRGGGPPVTAVVVFFLISGFVLYRPFVAARFDGTPFPRLMPYAVRRLARIVPAYWVALAITAVLLSEHYVFTPRGLITYFGFLQLYGRPTTVSGGISPAWTLCVEVTFYAALPLIALLARRLPARRSVLGSELWMCAGLVAVSLVWQGLILAIASPHSARILGLLMTLPGSLDLFAAGMALAALSVAAERGALAHRWSATFGGPVSLYWIGAFALLYAAGLLDGLYTRYGLRGWWVPTHELKAAAALLLLLPLILGGERRGWLRGLLGSRPMLWLGAASYGIYLWHQPLLDKLAPHLVSHGELLTMLGAGAAAVGAAALSLYLVERPAQRVAQAWLRRGAAASATSPRQPAPPQPRQPAPPQPRQPAPPQPRQPAAPQPRRP